MTVSSSCCGAAPQIFGDRDCDSTDVQRCPECGECCEFEDDSELFPTAEDRAMIAKIDALGADLSETLDSTLPAEQIPYDNSPRYISLDDEEGGA